MEEFALTLGRIEAPFNGKQLLASWRGMVDPVKRKDSCSLGWKPWVVDESLQWDTTYDT